MKNLSTRARIILLVLLSALPMLAVTLYSSRDEHVRAITDARNDLHRLAKLAAQHQEQVIEGARQTLVAISLMPATVRNDKARCNDYLAALQAKSLSLYHSIGIIGVDGLMRCNSVPWQDATNFSDRRYFQLAMTTGKFSIGKYQIGRMTKMQGINFGYPLADARGGRTGVAYVALNLNTLNKVAASVSLPEQGVLVVVDRDGTVLARNPLIAGRIGDKIPYPPVLKEVLASRDGQLEATGQGGVKRLIAFNAVAENPDGGIAMRVLVSVPVSQILADANHALRRDLAGILAATVLLMICAWYGAEIFVLRNIKKLLEVAKQLQAGRLSARTGVVLSNDEFTQLGAAFDNMAYALQQRDAELHRAMQELQQQAITDALTGLYNRRYLYEILPRELMLARRNSKPVAVLMLDIDEFKRVNDTYGHEAGDCVLKATAQLIKAAGRGSDYCFRYGGEEFLLVLPDSAIDGAQLRAEAIRAEVLHLEVICAEGRRVSVALSIGVAVFPEHGADADALLRAADEAMYEAKAAGRNRVMVHAGGGAARNPNVPN